MPLEQSILQFAQLTFRTFRTILNAPEIKKMFEAPAIGYNKWQTLETEKNYFSFRIVFSMS
jgi:hypothetical protein